jgi:hypothetical protein
VHHGGMNTATDPKKDQFESTLSDLKKRFAAVQRSASGRLSRGVPADLRRDLLAAWKASGESRTAFGLRFGLTGTSITNWEREIGSRAKKAKTKASPLPQQKECKSFKPISVVAEQPRPPKAEPANKAGKFCLELGSGARVTGLTLDDVLRLMSTQGGGK